VGRAHEDSHLCHFCSLRDFKTSAGQQPGKSEVSSPALRIDKIITARYPAGDFNGTVLVGRKGQELYQQAFGYADLGGRPRMTWRQNSKPDR